MAKWTCDIQWKHMRLMDKMQKYQQAATSHTKVDRGIVCFNDVSTCSLTTKRRPQGGEEKTNHEDTKWATVVL